MPAGAENGSPAGFVSTGDDMADKCAPEGAKTWHRYGFHIRTIWTVPNAPDPGQPDSLIVQRGRSVFVEYKNDNSAISLVGTNAALRPNQHEYIQKYALSRPLSTEVFLWIRLGNARVDATLDVQKKRLPRRTWLIPYAAFALAGTLFLAWQVSNKSALQISIPYTAEIAHRRAIRDNAHLGFDQLFKPFELAWNPGEGWVVPDDHVFWRTFRADPLAGQAPSPIGLWQAAYIMSMNPLLAVPIIQAIKEKGVVELWESLQSPNPPQLLPLPQQA